MSARVVVHPRCREVSAQVFAEILAQAGSWHQAVQVSQALCQAGKVRMNIASLALKELELNLASAR